jgi:hypothetical protein
MDPRADAEMAIAAEKKEAPSFPQKPKRGDVIPAKTQKRRRHPRASGDPVTLAEPQPEPPS